MEFPINFPSLELVGSYLPRRSHGVRKVGMHSDYISFCRMSAPGRPQSTTSKKGRVERERKTTITISTLLEILQRPFKTTILSQILPGSQKSEPLLPELPALLRCLSGEKQNLGHSKSFYAPNSICFLCPFLVSSLLFLLLDALPMFSFKN